VAGPNRQLPTGLPLREPTPEEQSAWIAEFEAAARRPLRSRFRYAFIHAYKPVTDDARFRAWSTMADYRAWLGHGRTP
jgi:hypothetical protein